MTCILTLSGGRLLCPGSPALPLTSALSLQFEAALEPRHKPWEPAVSVSGQLSCDPAPCRGRASRAPVEALRVQQNSFLCNIK